MAGHSRSKNGVASLAYVPAIHVLAAAKRKTWMPGTRPGMDENDHIRFTVSGSPAFSSSETGAMAARSAGTIFSTSSTTR